MFSYLKSFLWSDDNTDSFGGKSDEDRIDKVGFQVMFVRPESPSHLAGLVPVFDYIVAADDQIFFVCSHLYQKDIMACLIHACVCCLFCCLTEQG